MTDDGDRPTDGLRDRSKAVDPKHELDPERVRALFARALDDELTADERDALEEALAQSPDLDAELAALRRVVRAAGQLSHNAPSVDLLGPVQQKLRSRSGGRFYRDRFAERRGRGALLPWALGAAMLVVLMTLVWFAFETGSLGR